MRVHPRSRLSSGLGCLARVLVAATVPTVMLFSATDAFADEASAQDIAQARQLGQQAQTAFDAGNFAESEKLWAAAAKLYPQAPTLTLGLARTQAKLNKFVGAQESYNKIIREWSTAANPPPAFKDALEAAKAEVGAVSARVASVVISVAGPTNPQVTIDGDSVPAAALGLKRPVDPGPHTVKASAEGYTPAEATFTVAEAGNAEAKLTLEKAPGAVAGAGPAPSLGGTEPPPPGADTGGKSGSGQRTAALVAFGVGGVGLVVGAITGLVAMGKASDLDAACPNGLCPSDKQSDVDGYKTMGTLSTVGFIVAGVGGAAGAVLWFTAPKESSASSGKGPRYATVPASRVSVTPYVGLGAAGVTGRF